jgi:hypothetical protein
LNNLHKTATINWYKGSSLGTFHGGRVTGTK